MTQETALELLKLGHNVYITGPPGSGKTYLLNTYIDLLRECGVSIGITASTGIAATHMGGMTIHSWSGLGIRDSLSDQEIEDLTKRKYLSRRIIPAKVLILDEVSMMHSYRLDLIDRVCRAFKQNDLPFGGIQVILSGDFFQLPPVSRGSDEMHFAYTSQAWDSLGLKICYLEEQHRQGEGRLLGVLQDIRNNNVSDETLQPLRTRYRKNVEGVSRLTKLYTHNRDVDVLNQEELSKIEGESCRYLMKSHGNKKISETLRKNCLAPEELVLKRGAVVMFVKNNFDEGYVNGTLGEIVGFDDTGNPIVKTHNGKTITAIAEIWKIEEEGKRLAEIEQIPLRLAWAITVHKSQGMSLDAAEIDLSKSFVKGMGYVALSRVRSLDGIKLMGLHKGALDVDEEILKLDREHMKLSERATAEFETMDTSESQKIQKEFLVSITPPKPVKKLSTYEETGKLLKEKMSIEDIAVRRDLTTGTVVAHLEKLRDKGYGEDFDYLKKSINADRLLKIKEAFSKTKDDKLSPVRKHLGDDFSFDEIRLARLFIDVT